MAFSKTTKTAKDGTGATFSYAFEDPGDGSGFSPGMALLDGNGTVITPAKDGTLTGGTQTTRITDGTNTAAVKAGSISPSLTDPAVTVVLRPDSVQPAGQTTRSGSTSVVMASDSLSATANGLTSSRVNAAASTNATSLKASAGNIGYISVFNVAAYVVFLKLYNKASAPTVGTDTPIWTIPVAAGARFSEEIIRGQSFSTGIAYAITKLQADSDTTVVVAGDLTGLINWV